MATGSKGLGDRRQRVEPEQVLEHQLWLPPIEEQAKLAEVSAELNALKHAQADTADESDRQDLLTRRNVVTDRQIRLLWDRDAIKPCELFFSCGSTVAAAHKAGNQSQVWRKENPEGYDSGRFLKMHCNRILERRFSG